MQWINQLNNNLLKHYGCHMQSQEETIDRCVRLLVVELTGLNVRGVEFIRGLHVYECGPPSISVSLLKSDSKLFIKLCPHFMIQWNTAWLKKDWNSVSNFPPVLSPHQGGKHYGYVGYKHVLLTVISSHN